MKRGIIIRCIIILIVLTACGRTEESNKIDKERTTNEVLQMLDNYHESIRKEGLTGEFKYLDQSSDFFGFRLDTIPHYRLIP